MIPYLIGQWNISYAWKSLQKIMISNLSGSRKLKCSYNSSSGNIYQSPYLALCQSFYWGDTLHCAKCISHTLDTLWEERNNISFFPMIFFSVGSFNYQLANRYNIYRFTCLIQEKLIKFLVCAYTDIPRYILSIDL